MQTRQYRMRNGRRGGGTVNVGTSFLNQAFHQCFMGADKSATDTSGFTEGADVNNAIRLNVEVLQNAVAVFSEYTKAVGVIDNQQCIMGFCNRQQIGYWS